jgi:alpha-1,2-mannosyltransferase
MRTKFQQEIHLRDLSELAKPSNNWVKALPLLGVAFCLVVYYFTLFCQALAGFSNTIPLADYGSLYASVYAWAHHLNPYLDYPMTSHPRLYLLGLYVPAVNLNPPICLYLFRPIIAVGPVASYQWWAFISLCLFCISVVMVIRLNPSPALRMRLLLVLGMGGVWYTFQLGQIYMILLFLTVFVWRAFKKNHLVIAGVAIGILCALKPNFLIWLALLVLARHWKSAISGSLTFVSVSMVPLVFGDGVRTYRQWLTACRHFNGIDLASNSAIIAMLMRLDPYRGIGHDFRNIGIALTIAVSIVIAWCVLRKAPNVYKTSEIALVATLLVGPISWVGYTIMLIPMLYERRLNALMRIGWVLLCIPLFVVSWIVQGTRTALVLMGSPYFYGIILIGMTLMYELCREQTSTQTPSRAALPVPDLSVAPEPRGVVVREEK